MQIEIVDSGVGGWTIVLEGQFFRNCKTYSELATTIGSLVKSKYMGNSEGFI